MEDLRTIISVEEEEKQRGLQSDREKDRVFLEKWINPEDYPACPIGITLLRRFSEEAPDLYDLFVEKNLRGHQSVPAVLRHPKWIEYARHWDSCEDCSER